VHVVPAGVHRAGLRRPGRAGLLGDRQRVQLGPDRDARAGLRPDAHDPPGAADQRSIGRAERRRDGRGGPVLGSGQLGVGVQVVAEPDRAGELVVQRLVQRGRQGGASHGSSRYTRRALATPTRCPTRSASAADQAPSATNAPVTRARSRRNPAAPR
jgi:hypothetical protein